MSLEENADHQTVEQNDSKLFYNKGQYYAVTINPNDSHQFLGQENRFDKFRNYMYDRLMELNENQIDYDFQIELSEPRQLKPHNVGARYHIHGYIFFKSYRGIHYFLEQFQYKLTRYCVADFDTINDMEVWRKYMTKQNPVFGKRNTRITNLTE